MVVEEQRQQHFYTSKDYMHNRKTIRCTSYLQANILKLDFFSELHMLYTYEDECRGKLNGLFILKYILYVEKNCM